jgi:integrase
MSRLSTTALTKIQPGQIIYDDQVQGLHARANGQRVSFYLYFRTPDRKERRPKIGDYGTFTIPQAREIARDWLMKNATGRPIKSAEADSHTVQDLYEAWQRHHKPKLKPETARGQESQWQVHILPKMAKDRVADVTDDDIANIHAEISEKHPTQANRVLGLLSIAFTMAEKRPLKWRAQRTNPCYGIDRTKEKARKRYLTAEELQRIGLVLQQWEQNPGQRQRASRFFRLLMMTGARKNEIAKAKRAWLNLEARVLMLPDSKTGERTIALPKAAVELIKKMIADDPYSEWLCPGRRRSEPINNHHTAWYSLLEQAGVEDLRIHDLRHSFASVGLSMLGYNLKEIGVALGHRNQSTTEVYAHLTFGKQLEVSDAVSGAIERMMIPSSRADTLAQTRELAVVN